MLWGKSKVLVTINISSHWQASCQEETEIDLGPQDPAHKLVLGCFLVRMQKCCSSFSAGCSASLRTDTTPWYPPGRLLVKHAKWMQKQLPSPLGSHLLTSDKWAQRQTKALPFLLSVSLNTNDKVSIEKQGRRQTEGS